MKKIYMIPELHIVEIHCEQLIAESLNKYSGDGGSQLTKDEGGWDEVWDD